MIEPDPGLAPLPRGGGARVAARRGPLPLADREPDVGGAPRCAPGSSTYAARPTPPAHPVATLTLQPTSTWRGHRAGQYVQVGVELPGLGAPDDPLLLDLVGRVGSRARQITLTVRAHGEGQVSQVPRRDARAGPDAAPQPGRGRVHACRAARPRPASHPLLFITGGSGITPGDVDGPHAAA